MSTPEIPFTEVMMEPNRTPAESLFRMVEKKFSYTRDAWPMWARLVQLYGWPVVLEATSRCLPTKRFPNQVEAFCIEVAREAIAPQIVCKRREAVSKEEREARARAFAEARAKEGV